MNKQDALAGRIGANLKTLRIESGLSQKSLAQATQLSPTLISRKESGLVRPSIATLELIARSLKVDIGYFFRDEEKRKEAAARFLGDISRAADCKAMAENCMKAYGRIDTLHNNVGIGPRIAAGILASDEADWDRVPTR